MSDFTYIRQLPAPPARPADGHKGTFGRALIIGGSEGMSGAVCLAGYGALRGGAGLVTLAIPKSIMPIVACVESSWLTLPLESEKGRLSQHALLSLNEVMPTQSVIAIGPGLGQSKAIRSIVQHVNSTASVPVVIDADGLNALVNETKRLKERESATTRILTPHPGEFSRLIGLDTKTIMSNREEIAAEFAREYHIILLLKGPRTLITDGTRIAINETGNSGMATGGSGDVLTGLITALVAQGLDAFAAAHLGAHLHGLAGDLAAESHDERSLIASDLPNYFGRAWRTLRIDHES